MLLTFVFPGEPVPKQSFRVAKRGAFFVKYQTKDIVTTEKRIRLEAMEQLKLPFNPQDFTMVKRGDCRGVVISSTFYVSAPKVSNSKELQILTDKVPCIKRPDRGNYEKLIEDALTGVVWEDDACIFSSEKSGKYYSRKPRTVVTVKVVDVLKI